MGAWTKLPFSANCYLNWNSLIEIKNLSQPIVISAAVAIRRNWRFPGLNSYSELKNWTSCRFVYQQFSRPKITKMDQKVIYKYTYKPIFEKSAIWKNIWNSLCIYVFSFLITKCLFWWEKKRYIYLIYFQIWEVFKNRYLHICIKPKETQSF